MVNSCCAMSLSRQHVAFQLVWSRHSIRSEPPYVLLTKVSNT